MCYLEKILTDILDEFTEIDEEGDELDLSISKEEFIDEVECYLNHKLNGDELLYVDKFIRRNKIK
jgi:hypothetical protein